MVMKRKRKTGTRYARDDNWTAGGSSSTVLTCTAELRVVVLETGISVDVKVDVDMAEVMVVDNDVVLSELHASADVEV
jgi:hypothetical protein